MFSNKTKASEKIESPTSSIQKQDTINPNLENIIERKANYKDNLFENTMIIEFSFCKEGGARIKILL